MKVLVLNCGSSSIKYKLFDMDHKEVIAQGGIEKIGLKGSFLKLTLPDGGKKILEKDIPEHTVGVEFILNTLISPEYGAIKSLDEINAVGHRMSPVLPLCPGLQQCAGGRCGAVTVPAAAGARRGWGVLCGTGAVRRGGPCRPARPRVRFHPGGPAVPDKPHALAGGGGYRVHQKAGPAAAGLS